MGGDDSLSPRDKKILDSAVFELYNKQKIEFQFPPKILSDSNQSVWFEVDVWSIEPARIHKGSNGRRIKMEWEYLASDPKFTSKKISNELRKLKSYFFEFGKERFNMIYPKIDVKYTEVIPVITPFRLRDLSITYSEELINNNGWHPLHTKVSTDLELVTLVSNEEQGKEGIVVNSGVANTQWEWY